MKRFRGGLKGSITKLSKGLTEFLSVADAPQVTARQVTLKATLTKLRANNEKNYELLDGEKLQEAIIEDTSYEEGVN